MPQSYGNVYIHQVFSTKKRRPFLNKQLLGEFERYITPILKDCRSTLIVAGGMPDHVHLLADLGRESSVSVFAREVKSKSSHWIREKLREDFSWQSGYGVFSVSASVLQNVISYIKNQEEHHRHKSFQEEFEEMLIAANVPYDPKFLWVDGD
jgi:putative transposase